MIRITLVSLVVTMLIATPTWAQTGYGGDTMNCKDEMARFAPKMNSMTDQTKKAAATKEMGIAKVSLGKHDEATCMTHVHKAMNMTK
ncbi:MAG TPA: hypothetical protein VH020_00015 [Stellaceae bacterium]|jgi:hypothetical protein|nr:hypothetical protein [Stellaceae bacterium]